MRALFVIIAILLAAAPAAAQPARVSFVVAQPGEGRDIAITNDAVRATAERALARCEPSARAARPLDEQYFRVSVAADGRVVSGELPELRTDYYDSTTGTVRVVDAAQRRRATRFMACAARVLRRLRFPPGPAVTMGINVRWQEPGPPTLLLGVLPQ